MFKQSRYNIIQDLRGEGSILYNTKSGAIIEIDKENLKLVKTIFQNPNDFLNHEYFSVFLEEGFFVGEATDELSEVKNKYLKRFNSEDLLNIVLLPAEFCNFTCEYCFIYKYGGKQMDDLMYSNIIKYIRRILLERRPSNNRLLVNIGWYGGEPLLKRKDIISFMQRLKGEFNDNEIIFTSSIITNGYFLDYTTFDALMKNGVTTFQITFDGPEKYHNLTRKTRDGKGSYHIIMKNLKEIKNNVSDVDFEFSIRINFMKNNKDEIKNLIDDIISIVENDQRFYIYCRPIYNFETTREDIGQIESQIYNTYDGLRYQKEFTEYIADSRAPQKTLRMINDYLPLPANSWCAEDNKYSAIFGADGKVYYCDTLVGDESVSVGQLNSDGVIDFNEQGKLWRQPIFDFDNISDCENCKLLPICMGSCKRTRIEGNSKPCLYDEDFIRKIILTHYGKES